MHLFSGTSAIVSILGFMGVMAWRIREGRTAVSIPKIVMPPLGMSSGFCMFIVPQFRMPWTWALLAFLAGATLLAYPLLVTSKLVRDGDHVMMQRSNAFFLVVIGLALIRFLARGYLDSRITLQQSAGLFFILAFGMIVHWRLRMLLQYRALLGNADQRNALTPRGDGANAE